MDTDIKKKVMLGMRPVIGMRPPQSQLGREAFAGASTAGDETEFGVFK